MKKFFKYISVFAAMSLLAAGCQEKEEDFQPGEPELEGCYYVYFPAQEVGGVIEPTAPTNTTVTAARENAAGAITVPLEVVNESGVFTVGELKFEDGEKESSIDVDFSKADVGEKYSCTIRITDPLYASVYGTASTSISFSFTRVKWNSLGKADFHDSWMFENHYQVELQQRDDKKNMFRLVDPYSEGLEAEEYPVNRGPSAYLNFRIINPGEKFYDVTVNEKDLVYFEPVYTGYYSTDYSSEVVAYHPLDFVDVDYTHNKVLQYQSDGVTPAGVQLAPYYYMSGIGGWNETGNDGVVTIVFPGAVLTDYSIKVAAGQSDSEGILPVRFTTGKDVAKVKFALFEGALTSGEVAVKVKEVKADEKAASFVPEHENEYDVIDVKLEKTGEYTLVAVSYDEKGNSMQDASAGVTYLAAGDEEHAVVISAGLELTNRYASEGYTSENSALFYIYGKDIVSVSYGLFKSVSFEKEPDECIAAAEAAPADVVESVNDGGYSDLFTGLAPGTDYTFVVVASNGYASKVAVASVHTDGNGSPLYAFFTDSDAEWDYAFADKNDAVGEYNLYAVDAFGESNFREYLGKSVFALSETPDTEADDYGYISQFLNISGLAGPWAKEFGFDDTMEFELYGGILYAVGDPSDNYAVSTADGTTVYTFDNASGGTYTGSFVMGIPVAEGYYAIVGDTSYGNTYDFRGYAFYNPEIDPDYLLAGYLDYLFVDPAVDDSGLVPEEVAAAVSAARKNVFRSNKVETVEGARISAAERARRFASSVVVLRQAGINAEISHPAVEFSAVPFNGGIEKTAKTVKSGRIEKFQKAE